MKTAAPILALASWPLCFLIAVQCASCNRRAPSEEQLSDTQNRWVTVEYQGQVLSAIIPREFADEAILEDTFLLPDGVRRAGIGYFYAAKDALAYIGAFRKCSAKRIARVQSCSKARSAMERRFSSSLLNIRVNVICSISRMAIILLSM